MEHEEMVTIPLERLKALEALEASQAALLETERAKAVAAAKVERLQKLREFTRLHPEEHLKSSKKYYQQNKDEINAKRRAARLAKKTS